LGYLGKFARSLARMSP